MTALRNETTKQLVSKVKAQVVLPDDPSYHEVRKIWNAMIDRRPTVIVRGAEADEIIEVKEGV